MRKSLIMTLALVVISCGTSAIDPTTTDVGPPPETVAITTTAAVESIAPTTVAATLNQASEAATRSITIGGAGSAYAEPDRCTIDLGVTSRRATVAESGRAAAASADAMTEALVSAGVATRDIQTSEFSVYPYYDDYPMIDGYETHIGYRVTMADVEDVGAVLAAAMDAGGDDVRAWGIRFETEAPGLTDQARELAWADAIQRAEALAALAGEPLGEMLDAHEKVLVSTTQGMYQGGEGDSAHFDIPVSPGVAGVVVLLTVTFAIGG